MTVIFNPAQMIFTRYIARVHRATSVKSAGVVTLQCGLSGGDRLHASVNKLSIPI